MKITADSIVVAASGQPSANVGEEVVIAGLTRGNYYGLNPVAARVWELIQTPARTRDLRQAIAAEYDVTPERCGVDLLELLERLRDEGLIEVTEDR
ncbi:MAG TPA: PqqD family protein [Thermoanaerobaculia bacterium]|nr:PqqD family protein [Thermoanaerobaculia bacterium]